MYKRILLYIKKILIIVAYVVLTNLCSKIDFRNETMSRDYDTPSSSIKCRKVFKYRYKFAVRYRFFKGLKDRVQSFVKQ